MAIHVIYSLIIALILHITLFSILIYPYWLTLGELIWAVCEEIQAYPYAQAMLFLYCLLLGTILIWIACIPGQFLTH